MNSILLVTTNFWPEPTGSAPYATDLANSLDTAGYMVDVITGVPHYPWWKILEQYKKNPNDWISLNRVQIRRQSHYVPKNLNILTRILFELSLIGALNKAYSKNKSKKYDLIICIGSSLAGGFVAKKISTKLSIPAGIIVHDLAGQGATQSGLPGGTLIARLVTQIESKILQSATGIVAISEMMQEVILKMDIQERKVTNILIYSANPVTPINQNIARAKFGWASNEFIVLHTGNMGAKQHLENVVRAADALLANLRIRIFLVGHGNQESNLKLMCESRKNIEVLPAVSNEDYSALLSAADLLLVNERSSQMEMSLPSKLTSYLYSNRPVIAAVAPGGATWKFLDGIAELVEAGDPAALARKIEELSGRPEKLSELARLGREFADANLSPEVGRRKYLDWVKGLIAQYKAHS